MKTALFGTALIIAGYATNIVAAEPLALDGDLKVSELMAKCSSAEGGSEAQLKCFELLAQIIKQQEEKNAADDNGVSPIVQALENLRSAAEYQDSESGLSIEGNGCFVTFYYYGNYFRISRRNVSSIDLFYTQFDASQMQHDRTTQMQAPSLNWMRSAMESGSTAVSRGGHALESTTHNFTPKTARESVGDYAIAVIDQLPARANQTFEFVLVHPKRAKSSMEIIRAFDDFVDVCKT